MRDSGSVIVAPTLLAVLLAGGGIAPSASAAVTVEPTAAGESRAPLGLTAGLGLRTDLVRSSGLDAFSEGDGLLQSALSIEYHLAGDDHRGLRLGLEWNHGTTSSHARAAVTSLVLDRLSLTVEGRLPILRRLSAFGRLAPALLRHGARVTDPSVPAGAYTTVSSPVLEQARWLPAVDAGAGLAFLVTEIPGQGSPALGFWLVAEGGYGLCQGHDLVLGSRAETQPGRVDEPLRLGELSLRGAYFRAHLAVSF